MVSTKISDLHADWGQHISINRGDKHKPCYADGAVKAGMFCGINATNYATAVDADDATTGLTTEGFAKEDIKTDIDTALPALDSAGDKTIVNLIAPQSGKKYECFIEDPAGTKLSGTALKKSTTTAGSFVITTWTDALAVAKTAEEIVNTQTATVLEWL